MIELLENGDFTLEARGGGFAGRTGDHHLDGHAGSGLYVATEVNRAHGAGTELFFNLERTELLTDEHDSSPSFSGLHYKGAKNPARNMVESMTSSGGAQAVQPREHHSEGAAMKCFLPRFGRPVLGIIVRDHAC